jgi:A/G-specific adenine glycosylase
MTALRRETRLSAGQSTIAPRLLAWFDHAGRKSLPWQHQPTPYRVWVSEIMLQQTQVATVIGYYERFLQRFPDVATLARASVDEVLHLWTGLGYYARGRNLHRAAQLLVQQHGGEFPESIDAVEALPGIGRSTAGAILALSRGRRHPILDGNVKRVLSRYFGVEGHSGVPSVQRDLWDLAERCTPVERIAHYTQAIMDLGATLCVRSRPLCHVCPLSDGCYARREGLQSALPTPRPKKIRPQKTAHAVIALREDGAVLLERRPPVGLWGGLWTFPQFDDLPAARDWCVALGEASAREDASFASEELPPYLHAFTHFDLTLRPWLIRGARERAVLDADRYCWYDPQHPPTIGLTKPAVDLIRVLSAPRTGQQRTLL